LVGFDVLQQQINLIRRFFSNAQTPDSVIAPRHFLDMEVIEREFWAFWETSGRKPFSKGADAAFIGFTKKKYGQIKYGKK